jgi:FkbM family methyltransferase
VKPYPEWGSDDGSARASFEAACRRECRSVYIGSGLALAKVLERYYMYLQVVDTGIGHHLLFDGFWESWLTLGVRSCLRPGMTVVDVGSNHGYYTLVAADVVGSDGRVFAYEPQPDLYELQRRTVFANGLEGRVVVKRAAAGDFCGRATLSIPDEWRGGATLLSAPHAPHTALSEIEVEVTTLDSELEGETVDFVKIDVEGAEPQVVAGMNQLIEDNPTIQIGLEFYGGLEPQAQMLADLAERDFVPHVINYSGELHEVGYAWLAELPFDPMIIFRRRHEL